MKVQRKAPEIEEKKFEPIEVSVIIEREDEMAALKSHYGNAGESTYEADGIMDEHAFVLCHLVDSIYKQAVST